jgi:predicted nucleic acid-binding protein
VKVVADASPLVFLSKLGALALLEKCISHILVPKAVVEEIRGVILPGFVKVQTVSQVGSASVQEALERRLHRGELEVTILAQESNADAVLMDDLLARRHAKRLRLLPIGTVGVLLLAHHRGYLSAQAVIDYLDELHNEHGMYLSDGVIARVKANLRP